MPKKVNQTKNTNVAAEEVPQQNPIEAKLDRIIVLLEGTLQVKSKGFDFKSNPLWEKMIDR